jgi:LmbE family N-acetylglucosaminyl deacetylase
MNTVNELSKEMEKIPVALPHFICENNRIFSLKGRLFSDIPDEVDVFLACDGKKTLADISDSSVLKNLLDKKVITLLPKQIHELKVKEKVSTVLVLSPHVDDGALSLGGIMRRSLNRYVVLNIFSSTKFQTGLRVPEEMVIDISQKEDRLVGRCLNFESIFAGKSGAIERYNLTTQDIVQNRFSSINENALYQEEIAQVKELIIERVNLIKPEIILSPLGLGGHIDHLITACAAISLVEDKVINKHNIAFYEDLPYAAAFPWSTSPDEQPLVYKLEPGLPVDITDVLSDKLFALRIYLTRVRQPQIDICCEYGRKLYKDGNKVGERLWKYSGFNHNF